MRADVYLHHVRIFKSRSLSAQACSRGQVLVNAQSIKPARELKVGDHLDVTRGDLRLILRVIAFPEKRVGAPLVGTYLENLTPPECYQKAAEARRERSLNAAHERAAKPDKKQLRQIREWMSRRGE